MCLRVELFTGSWCNNLGSPALSRNGRIKQEEIQGLSDVMQGGR
jgi:hypothetical protein